MDKYSKGKSVIVATEKAYELIYKNQGYTPVAGGKPLPKKSGEAESGGEEKTPPKKPDEAEPGSEEQKEA